MLRLDVLDAMMHATLTIVVARALVASADELLLQPGHCGVTTASRQSCAHDSQSSGAWKAASLRACLRRCASCPRCSVASYSSRDSDCSWYARCDVSTRGLTQGTGHETVVVRHANGTVLRAVERLVEKGAGGACRPYARGRGLEMLASLCFQPDAALDIGANVGDWTRRARELFPSTRVVMVDGNEHTDKWQDLLLESPAQVLARAGVILDAEARDASWYSRPDQAADTGASLFQESTRKFTGLAPQARRTQRLDDLVEGIQFEAGARRPHFALVKLDVQGAELSVLRGGPRVLSHAEVLQLELPVAGKYNAGSPSFVETIAFLNGSGFEVFDIFDPKVIDAAGRFVGEQSGFLVQQDVLLVRRGSALLKHAQHAIHQRG